jgi:hypothetical protein
MRTIGSGRFKANESPSTSNRAPLEPSLPRDLAPSTRCAAGSLRSQGPPRGLRWIGEREVDWTDTANCDNCRFILAADHPVVMRSSSRAVHEAAGRRRHARSGVEISAAVDPPTARDNDAEPVAGISMRRAHVSGMPADKDIIKAWRSAVPGQRTNVGAAVRKRGLRFPLQRVG